MLFPDEDIMRKQFHSHQKDKKKLTDHKSKNQVTIQTIVTNNSSSTENLSKYLQETSGAQGFSSGLIENKIQIMEKIFENISQRKIIVAVYIKPSIEIGHRKSPET